LAESSPLGEPGIGVKWNDNRRLAGAGLAQDRVARVAGVSLYQHCGFGEVFSPYSFFQIAISEDCTNPHCR